MISFVSKVLCLAGFLAFCAGIAFADIKDAVFRDCDLAVSEFQSLEGEKQTELLPFLREVLKLRIPAPEDPIAPLPVRTAPGLAAADSDLQLIWRGFSADREAVAKRCALKLLHMQGAAAGAALPEIVEFAADPTLSDEMQTIADETAMHVAKAFSPSALKGAVIEIAQVALSERGDLAQVVLGHFAPSTAIEAIYAAVRDDDSLQRAVRLLNWLDPWGSTLQAVTISSIKPETPGIPTKAAFAALGNLTCPNEDAAAVLITALDAADTEKANAAFNALKVLTSQLAKGPICRPSQEGISGTRLLGLLLEKSSPAPDEATLERLTLALPLLSGRISERAQELAIALLKKGDDASAALAREVISALGPQILEALIAYLNDTSQPNRALTAGMLRYIPAINSRQAKPFVRFLTDEDPGVRSAILELALRFPRDLRPEAKNLPAVKDQKKAFERQLLFVASGLSLPSSMKNQIGVARCEQLDTLVGILDKNRPAAIETALRTRSDECGQIESTELCSRRAWIFELKKVSDLLKERLNQALESSEPECVLLALSQDPRREIPDDKLSAALAASSEPEARAILQALAKKPQLSANDLKALQRYSRNTEVTSDLRCQALSLYVRAEADESQRRAEVERVLEDAGFSERCISSIPPAVVLPSLIQQLSEARPNDNVQAIQLARRLQSISPEALDRIAAFRDSKIPEVRYQTLLALAMHSAASPESARTLGPLLETRFALRLAYEASPSVLLHKIQRESDLPSAVAENTTELLRVRSLREG